MACYTYFTAYDPDLKYLKLSYLKKDTDFKGTTSDWKPDNNGNLVLEGKFACGSGEKFLRRLKSSGVQFKKIEIRKSNTTRNLRLLVTIIFFALVALFITYCISDTFNQIVMVGILIAVMVFANPCLLSGSGRSTIEV
jgi:hypothetical protein